MTEGQTLSGRDLIGALSDSSGRAPVSYLVEWNGGGGALSFAGHALKAGVYYQLTAAQLSSLSYSAGSKVGTDSLLVAAYNGVSWSNFATDSISVKAPLPAPPAPPVPPPPPPLSGVAAILAQIGDAGVKADLTQQLSGTSLSYSGMLKILQDASVGGMTASKFSSLQTLDKLLNATGGITMSPYVQQISDDVILGSSANATWNGGAATATALGNLSATSSQTQSQELVGMWFLGANLPSAAGSGVDASTYQTSTLPLYGASGAPNYLDVNQGENGDCYMLAALGETALQNSTAIQNMISSNGNGTYSIRFFVGGKADYVTVNEQLPVFSNSSYQWANGARQIFANGAADNWVALVEKGFAELNAQPGALVGNGAGAGNSYTKTAGGWGSIMQDITGQSVVDYSPTVGMSAAATSQMASTLASAFQGRQELFLGTSNNSQATSANLVDDHLFMVTGVNAAAGTVTLHNPWSAAYSGPLAMNFTASLAQLASAGCTLEATTGSPHA